MGCRRELSANREKRVPGGETRNARAVGAVVPMHRKSRTTFTKASYFNSLLEWLTGLARPIVKPADASSSKPFAIVSELAR